jgi:Zn ribbon nucleic-acid-binding protein
MTAGGQTMPMLYNTEDILKLWDEGKTVSEIAECLQCHVATVATRLDANNISKKERLYRANAYKAIPIEQYTLDGVFVAGYSSIAAAVRSLNNSNANTSNICYACEHKLTSAYHFIWKYKNDEVPIKELVKQVKAKKHHGQQKVNQYDKNGNFIKTFDTIKDAAQAMGLKSISAITNACTGLSKTSKGFIWKYAN